MGVRPLARFRRNILLAALAAAGLSACGGTLDLTASDDADAGGSATADGGTGDGSSCTTDCAIGTTSCRGGGLSTCVVDALGCSEWTAPIACPTTESCIEGESACRCASGSILVGGICLVEQPITPPRALAPLSTATVTSQLPTLKWALASGDDGAVVEICRDRACTESVVSFAATGSSGAPPAALAAGLYYWRLRGTFNGAVGKDTTPAWEFFVGARSAVLDTSWGTIVDPNGDGLADVLVGADQENKYTGAAYLYLADNGGLASPPITIASPAGTDGTFGSSVASAGDVNGDGYADVIVGALAARQYIGAAYVYLAGPAGLSSTPTPVVAPSGYSGLFGASVASAGDLNGDGYADVVVGASGNGGAFVFLGSPSGPSTTSIALVLPIDAANNGRSVASAGDVNGDGFADVIIGAPSTTNGAAYLYLGAAAGVSVTPQEIDAPILQQEELYFATSVASAGDVNGDGYADVVVGSAYGGAQYSNAFLYMGGAGGLSTTPILLPHGTTGSTAGDVNGDGFADVVLGALGLSGVGAYVYYGGAGGLSLSPETLAGSPTSYGDVATGGGDVNGDGFADILVGMPSNDAGSVSVFFGAAAGPATTSSLVITDGTSSTSFGGTLQ